MTNGNTKTTTAMFWNLWGHRHPGGLHRYITIAPQPDVYCFTEVTDVDPPEVARQGTNHKYGDRPEEHPQQVDGMTQLINLLGENYWYRYVASRQSDWTCEKTHRTYRGVGFGSALFYKKDLLVREHGSFLLCDGIKDIRPRVAQWIVYEKNGTIYLLAHFHGIWIKGNTKGDHPARRLQSKEFLVNLRMVAKTFGVDKVVFGGDFNLDIDNPALSILEEGFGEWEFDNLIARLGVKNTRTLMYRDYDTASRYADYVMTSTGVVVEDFSVNNNILASDHAPLRVEFF